MTKKRSKRPADIITDRYNAELPILDRVLPTAESLSAEPREPQVTEPSADDTDPSATDPADTDTAASQVEMRSARVTMNTHHLEYEQSLPGLSFGRRLLGALLPAVVVVAAVGALLVPAAAGAQIVSGSDDAAQQTELSVKSIRFDITTPETPGPTAYRSLVVTKAGTEHNLQPMPGSVRVLLSEADAAAMTAVVAGATSTAADAGFTDALAGALTSAAIADFATFGADQAGQPVAVDIYFDRPLGPGDHLLLQEGNGDGAATITALDAAGAPAGISVPVGAPYQVNTGHSQDQAGGVAAWSSVIDVQRFGLGSAPVAGLRLSAANVEIKAMALVAVPSSDSAAAVLADGVTPMYASVGLEAMVQPALAVDGAGCLASPAAPVAVGQAATFCFLVTNLGTTDLTDVRLTDPQLGLVNAELPIASGEPTLRPGDQVVLYHHTVAGERPEAVGSIVSARPVDQAGNPISNLIAPTGVAGSGAITPAGALTATDGDGAAVAGTDGVLTPGSAAEVVEVPATRANGVADPADGSAVAESDEAAPKQLAMTGVRTEPWILVLLAMGLIFTGYTAFVAFNGHSPSVPGRPSRPGHFGEPSGHSQLDSLGFD